MQGFNDWTGKYPTTVGSTGGLNGSSGKTIAQGSSGGKGGGHIFYGCCIDGWR